MNVTLEDIIEDANKERARSRITCGQSKGVSMMQAAQMARFARACAASLLAFLATAMTALSLASCVGTPAPSFSQEQRQNMELIVDDAMAKNGIPGLIVGVWVPGMGNWVIAKGQGDTATGQEIRTTDKVRIASNTKPFVATVALQLVDEGRIGLEDPLAKYITGVPYGDQITLRQLLDMTAGIFNFTDDQAFNQQFNANPLMELTPEQELQIALSHPPYFQPGQGWHYSDTNYEILGMIIEKVTGGMIEDEMQGRILDPLGLENSSFPTTSFMPENSSKGYVENDSGQLVDYTQVNPSVPWAGGAMISNLDDLKIWAKALATGQLISEELQAQRLQGVPIPGQEKIDGKYGLGILRVAGFLGHTGAIFGYNSSVFYLPKADATFVILANKSTNASNETGPIFLELAKMLFPDQF